MAALNSTKNKFTLISICTCLLFIIDRLTKYFSFKLPPEGVFVSPNFGFKLYLNDGIAFSLPLAQLATIIISILIIISLLFFLIKNYQLKNNYFVPMALIIIGAVSNVIDRLKFKGVVDFIDLWFIPAFNLSDVYIIVGIVWLIILINQRLPKIAE